MAQTDVVIGATGGLRLVMERVHMVASNNVPVLLFGETGTGKEVVARSIHERSQRRGGPFWRVNCGAISPDLIDSELFGHERGSFTGATGQRKGWFEQAHGGTLFLDEIGELSLAAQVRLLRVLQEGELLRVGGEQPLRVDVRIVAATHRDLAAMVASHMFREDLYYRLAVFPIVIPPLRDRIDDITELARHFADRAAHRFGLRAVAPSQADVKLLCEYRWPGNIRELAAVIDRAVLLGEGRRLDVQGALGFGIRQAPAQAPDIAPPTRELESLDLAIKHHIERALALTHGRVDGPFGAAKLLDVNPNTLRARMRKLRIDWRRYRAVS